MLKPEIAPDQLKDFLEHWDTRVYLDQVKRGDLYTGFAVGDVVVNYFINFGEDDEKVKKYEVYNATSDPVKYMIVHKDPPNRSTLARRINTDGKLGKTIICLEMMRGSWFEMDRRAIDHTLLNEEYHAEDDVREMRERKSKLRAANNKNSVRFKTIKEAEAWIADNLQVGSTYWTIWGTDSLNDSTEHKIAKITKHPLIKARQAYWDPDKAYRAEGLTKKMTLNVDVTSKWGTLRAEEHNSNSLIGRRIFTSKPRQLKDEQ